MTQRRVPRVMTIAGSDSGGGAGLQADLKTFGAMGVYGTCAITTITAQNTLGVRDVLETPVSLIESQIDAVVSDIGADAVKTGMLSSSEIIRVVAQSLERHNLNVAVIDPVMVASTGARLIREDAIDSLREALIPKATVLTPNSREAGILVGMDVDTVDDARTAARILVDEFGAGAAVVKGGHLEGPATDILYDGSDFIAFTAERIDTPNTHGTGCTLASAIAAGLAKRLDMPSAVQGAKDFVTAAMRASYSVGEGHGPLNHFYKLWDG